MTLFTIAFLNTLFEAPCIVARCGIDNNYLRESHGKIYLTFIILLHTVDREQLQAQLPNCEIAFPAEDDEDGEDGEDDEDGDY